MNYHYIKENSHYFLVGFANVAGWVQGFIANNFSVGAVVTLCTVGVPAVVGAVNYTLKTAGPVWLEYLANRDKLRSSMIGSKIDALNANLELSQRESALNQKIAQSAEAQAKEFQYRNEELNKKMLDLLTKTGKLQVMIEDSNRKIHDLSDAATIATHRADVAEEDRKELQLQLFQATEERKSLQVKIDQMTLQLRKNSEPILDTHAKVSEIAEVSEKVNNLIESAGQSATKEDHE